MMQDTLYPLSTRDIEAISRARVNRAIPSGVKIWLYVALGVFIVGLYVAYTMNALIGMGVMVLGVVLLWRYTAIVDKRRKALMRKLKLDLQDEGSRRGETR